MKSQQFHTLHAKLMVAGVIVILAVAVLPMLHAFAATCTSKASGLWSAAGTWSAGCSGSGGVPGSGDDVVIANGNAVTFDVASATVNSLTINGGVAASSLSIVGSNALTVSGNVIVNTPTANVNNFIAVGAGTLNVGGNLQLDASATGTRRTQLTMSTGTVTVNGNITNTNSTANSQVVFSGAGTLNVGGNYAGSGTFTKSTGTVNFDGAAQIIPAYAYNNLTFSGSGAKTMNNGTTIGGILTLGGTASATSVENLTIGGTLVVGPRTAFSTGLNYTLTVTGASTIGGSLILNGTGTKTFSSDVTINDGGFWDETGVAAINFAGNLTNNGTFTASTGTHTFTGNTKTIGGANPIAIPNLTVNGNTTNSGSLTVASALAGTATLTNGAGATLNMGGINTVGTFTPNGANNTVNYTGGAQAVRGAAYVNLSLGGSGVKTMQAGTSVTGNMVLDGSAGAVSATTAANLAITGSLTVGSNTSLATTSNYTLGVTGSTTVSGTLDLESTGADTFTGATTVNGTLTLAGTGAKAFSNDLTINASGVYNETGVASVANAGSLTNNGTYSANTGIHAFSGAVKTFGGTSPISLPSLAITGTITNNGTVSVSTALTGAGTLTNGASGTLNYAGAGAIVPTLNASIAGNTVNYSGAAQTVKVTTYNNLVLSGSGLKTMAGGITAIDVSIDPYGGSAQANLSGNSTTITLALGGTGQPHGTYGGTGSGATYINSTYFATNGTNKLTVSSDNNRTTPTITFTLPLPMPTYLGADFSVPATTTNTDSSALTYSVISGPCSLVSGSTFHATGAGPCVVQAYGAATANFYAAFQTVSISIAKASQAALTVSADPAIAVQGYTTQLSTSGGSGTGGVTYSVSGGGCTVNPNTGLVSITNSSLTCSATATKATDTNYLSATSSPLSITMAPLESEINKSFSSGSNAITPGTEVQLTITVFNPNLFNLVDEGWTDNLAGEQPGIYLVSDTVTHSVLVPGGNTCGYTVDEANAGSSIIAVSGGTVPAKSGNTNGSCTLIVNVSSITPGNLINTIDAGVSTATGTGAGSGELAANTTPASATLLVRTITPPSLSKTFIPNTIWAGDKSLLTITITNNDPSALTQMSLTDNLPGNVVIANPASASLINCGSASLTANPGETSVALSGAGLPAGSGSVCTIQVYVTSNTQGSYTNSIPAGAISTYEGATNAQAASAPLNVQQLNLTKSFSPASIAAGGTSTGTITLQNPSSTAYTNASLIDNLPGGLTVTGTPTTTCAGGTFDTSLNTRVYLQTATIPAGTPGMPGTCTVSFTVTTPANATTSTQTNTIAAGSLQDDQNVSNPTSVRASISITNGLTGAKSFAPGTIVAGGTSAVTITLQNWTASAFTNVTLSDSLAGFHLTVLSTPTPTSNCPAGTVTYTSTSISFNGGTIPASANSPAAAGTCTITFSVQNDGTVTSPANTIVVGGVCATDQGVCNLTAFSSTLTVRATGQPVVVSKAFQNGTILPGATNRLIITLTSPIDSGVTHMGMSDTLPGDLVIASAPAPTTTCSGDAGILDPVIGTGVGTNKIQLGDSSGTFGATLAANASCTITVYVTTGTTNGAGSYTNTIPASNIVTAEGRTNTSPTSASFQVTGLSVTKAFYPTIIAAGGYSTLTITLDNSSSLPLTGVNLTDALTTMGSAPNNVVIGKTTSSNSCGGSLTPPVVGASSITLTGGYIPAKSGSDGICTISVVVQGLGSNTTPRLNTIPIANVSATAGTSTINPIAAATATLTITPLTITANKSFNPVIINVGSVSTLSITLNNPNNVPLTGISFTDTMVDSSIPSKGSILLATPANLNAGSCVGPDGKSTSVVSSGTSGTNQFTFSNIDLAANSSCTLTASTTTSVNGTLTNTIPAGGITTYNGVATTSDTSASLTNLPGLGVAKSFSPNPIVANGVSTLTITLTNTGATDVTDIGLTDTLPSGLSIASSPDASTTCGSGTVTAAPGTQAISLATGYVAAGGSCTISVPVTSSSYGCYLNTIPANSITTNGSPISNDAASDTLCVMADTSLSTTPSPGGMVGIRLNDTASLSGGSDSPAPTGTVTFKLYPPTDATCSLSPDYSESVSLAGTSAATTTGYITNVAGTWHWTADYSGDTNNDSASSGCSAEAVTVTQAIPTITTSASPTTGTVGTNILAAGDSVTSLGSAFNPTGNVTFTLYSNPVCTSAASGMSGTVALSGGTASWSHSWTPPAPGTYYWQVAYAGDTNNAPVTSSCTASNEEIIIAQAKPTIVTTASPTTGTVGTANTFGDSATLSGGYSPSGSVTFMLYSDLSCSTAVSGMSGTGTISSGSASWSTSWTPTAPGTYYWQASYPGNTNNAAFTSTCGAANEQIIVSQANPTIATTAKPTTGTVGTAALTGDSANLSGGYNPSGSVTFTLYSDGSCNTTVAGMSGSSTISSGTASWSTNWTPTAPGTYYWRASYPGDTNNAGFTTTCGAADEQIVVSKASPSITTTSSPTTGTVGTSNSFGDSATLSGAINPTGSVTFTLYSDASCSTAVAGMSGSGTISSGSASWSNSWTPTGPGTYYWQANYPGDDNNAAFTTTCGAADEQIVVSQASPSIMTTASPTTGTVGTSDSFGDSATLNGAYNPTGSINFSLYSDSSCSSAVSGMSGNGVITSEMASWSTSWMPTAPGTYYWQASYPGDTNNAGFTSTCGAADEQIVVGQASLSITTTASPSVGTVGTSDSFGDSATLSGAYNPTGSVTFTLYSDSNCSGAVTGMSGNGTISSSLASWSKSWMPTAPSTYYWQASYPGDDNNAAFTSTCGATDEQIVVGQASPSIGTTVNPTTGTVGIVLNDTADLTGGNSPTGTVTFQLYPPSDADCSSTPSYTEGPISLTGSSAATTTGFASNAVGTWHWVAVYNGDSNNNSVSSNCADEPVTVNPITSADLSITKTDGVTSYSASASVTYTITVTNVGRVDVPGATVADAKPANILNWAWACTSQTGNASGCTPAASGTADFSNVVDMPVDSTIVYTVTANIVASPTGDLVNTATVTLPDGYTDATPGNNTSTDTDKILADLSITKTDGVTTYTAGGTTTYKVTVFNGGNVDVTGATVTDPKPANILNWAWACTSQTGNASGCTPAASGTADFSNVVNLPVDSTIVYTVTANIVANPTGALVNTATVTLPDIYIDPNGNSVSSTDEDTQAGDLSITKTDGETTFSAGGNTIYIITVTNAGNVGVPGATVTDPKPANILNWAWACTSQNGGASGCTPAASGSADFSNIVNLPVGGSIIYTVTANIVASPTGDLVNTATVTMPDGYSDLTPGNNTATDTDTRHVQPSSLPGTGFAPNKVTKLARQTTDYADLGDLWLEIPRLGVKIPIAGVPEVNGTWDVSWLGSQAGWLNGTAYPTSAGDSILTGHVYDAFGQPGPFVHLNGLWYGDQIIIHEGGLQYVYEVREVMQVTPNAVSSVIKHEDLPWVTLITCRGYDEASNSYKYRVAVRAVLVKVK